MEFIDEYAEKLNGQTPQFEPREDHKGDAARAMFYFFAMYHGHADTNFWNIQKDVLFDWHNQDPVNELELSRTWVIAGYQDDYPNPFILDSSLARRIWSVQSSFDNNAPGEFSLSLPIDNSIVSNLTPEFIWSVSIDLDPLDTVSYTLILDSSDPGIESYSVGQDTQFVLGDPLNDNSQYYWQVLAEDLAGNQTLNQNGYISFFTNLENEPPSSFEILSPNENSIQMDLSPNFSWTESTDPDPLDSIWYRLEIFGPMIAYYPWQYIVNTTETNFTPDFSLYDNSSFYFNIRATDLHGESIYTEEYIFHTDSFPEPPLNFATIFPENNEERIDPQIEFIWNATTDPDPLENIHYQLVYATNWQDSATYSYSELLADTSIVILLEGNSQYAWSVIAKDSDGFNITSNSGVPNILTIGTLSANENVLPEAFDLHQNYPNPFNPITTLGYDIPEESHVRIQVYDLSGNFVVSLLNDYMNPGFHSVQWDATNHIGHAVSAGLYLYEIQAGDFSYVKKMLLIK